MKDTLPCAYGILLAGGKSSRMNQDKALLSIGDTKLTLLEHQKKLLSRVAHNVIISRNEPPYIQDMYHGCGPLAGIHAAISHVGTSDRENLASDAIILPVDMPLINRSLLCELVEAGRKVHRVTHFHDNNLPIYLPNMSSALVKLSQLLSNNRRIVNTFLEETNALDVPCDEPKKIVNANTPMQWKIMHRALV